MVRELDKAAAMLTLSSAL